MFGNECRDFAFFQGLASDRSKLLSVVGCPPGQSCRSVTLIERKSATEWAGYRVSAVPIATGEGLSRRVRPYPTSLVRGGYPIVERIEQKIVPVSGAGPKVETRNYRVESDLPSMRATGSPGSSRPPRERLVSTVTSRIINATLGTIEQKICDDGGQCSTFIIGPIADGEGNSADARCEASMQQAQELVTLGCSASAGVGSLAAAYLTAGVGVTFCALVSPVGVGAGAGAGAASGGPPGAVAGGAAGGGAAFLTCSFAAGSFALAVGATAYPIITGSFCNVASWLSGTAAQAFHADCPATRCEASYVLTESYVDTSGRTCYISRQVGCVADADGGCNCDFVAGASLPNCS